MKQTNITRQNLVPDQDIFLLSPIGSYVIESHYVIVYFEANILNVILRCKHSVPLQFGSADVFPLVSSAFTYFLIGHVLHLERNRLKYIIALNETNTLLNISRQVALIVIFSL